MPWVLFYHRECKTPNVEFSRSMMRADKVFKVLYHGKPYILNIEFNELSERYRDDHKTLAEQFIWMQLCINRTKTIKLAEKIHIKERLSMFDQLWEQDPTIQKMRAEYLQKGIQKGVQKGRQEERREVIQGLKDMLVDLVRVKYPDLVELAQEQASHFENPKVSQALIYQVTVAPNADMVRQLLEQKAL